MKVKELISELKKMQNLYPELEEVFVSRDIEGNGIHEIYEVAITKDGHFEDTKRGEKGAEQCGDKYIKWIEGKDLLTIYPSDTAVDEDHRQ